MFCKGRGCHISDSSLLLLLPFQRVSRPTLMQPMMEVVRAELYCVHSMMEYIKTKLQNRGRARWDMVSLAVTRKRSIVDAGSFTPWHRRAQTAPGTSGPTSPWTLPPANQQTAGRCERAALWKGRQCVLKKCSPLAGLRSSRRTPWWAGSWSERCSRGARTCPAPAQAAPSSLALLMVLNTRCSSHLGIQFLLHVRPAGRSQDVVKHDEDVSLKVERQVVTAGRKTVRRSAVTRVVARRKHEAARGSVRLALPGCDKRAEDHGEDGHLDRHGEGLPVRKSWNIFVIWENNKDVAPWCLSDKSFDPLQQHSFEHHGEENAESPQHGKHGQAERQEIELKKKTKTWITQIMLWIN